jgi:hypothetical protein
MIKSFVRTGEEIQEGLKNKDDFITSHVSKGMDRQPFLTLSKLLETGCLSTRDTSGSVSIRLDKMQIQDSIQLITPERLLCCYILLLHNNIASTNRTLRLHTKDTPSHRQRFYTHNLNGKNL